MSGIGFTPGMTGRADLVRARRLGDPDLEEFVAGLLGYRLVPPEPPPIEPRPKKIGAATPPPLAPTSATVTRDIPLWQASHFEIRVRPAAESGGTVGSAGPPKVERSTKNRERKPVGLRFMPLSSSASLLTRLRAASPTQAIGGDIDVDRIVEEWGRGRFLPAMPRSSRKSWGRSVQVLVDRSRRLIPYWEDQRLAYLAMRDVYPPDGFSTVVLPEGCLEPSSMKIGGQAVDYRVPPPGSAVVALSDLGALARGGSEILTLWVERGRLLRNLGVTPLAVVPCRRAVCPKELSRYWTILTWETSDDAPALSEAETTAVVGQVLALLSFTLRIEPQLIRFVRRLLSAGRGEPGIESRVWQDEAFGDHHCEAAALAPGKAASLLRAHARQDAGLRSLIYERVEDSHREVYMGLWYAEMGNLSVDGLIDDEQRREMCDWFKLQADLLESEPQSGEIAPLTAWHRDVSERLKVAYRDRDGLGPILHRIWSIVHRDDPDAVLPDGADPIMFPPETERTIELRQFGDRLIASHGSGMGSSLALLRTCQSRLKVEPFDDFWKGGAAPAWADDWGRDDFGPWVRIRVEKVTQRLRWIPPGTFWMGSPDDEEKRYPGEGPRHKVTIAQGFWMFDTPCTQALWEAVMGENPSFFKGKDRPVETVSWEDCQGFITLLKQKCHGLELTLPTEEQWEYACRAGTETARYRENLDNIAWYAENSDWESHPVGQKAANDWGLYDTLGNVYEWCANTWTSDYSEKSRVASAVRVIRGGSWLLVARSVRAAYRYDVGPAARVNYVGCRLAEFKSRCEPSIKSGKPVETERARERVGGSGADGDRDQASGVGWINLDGPGMDGVSFAALAPVRIRSDVEQVVLNTLTLPEWASAIGRDRYGLWAEFTIDRSVEKSSLRSAPIRQRLRWIPPGRFMMGSPKEEKGRLDWEQLPHEVAIDEGFWMFATPCTQALWEALMDQNPSRFQSPDRPVEQVSWADCVSFATKLSERIGLTLAVPSEAQWEYACRAGTKTSTYAGPLEIKGINNAPILDEIAWYGGNSGHEFDLADGVDAGWPEKQYPFDKAGTRPVAKKRANPWGLYDMLGNVWEWCADTWVHGGSGEASADRVIRGGSWYYDARYVRAAYRNDFEPAYRLYNVGCRLAEFRSGRELSEQSGVSRRSEAEVAERPETASRRTKRRRRKQSD